MQLWKRGSSALGEGNENMLIHMPYDRKFVGKLRSENLPLHQSRNRIWLPTSAFFLLKISKEIANSKNIQEPYMDVSENSGSPRSSILIGFSIINHSSTAMWTVLARDNIFLLGWHQSELIIGHSHAMVHAASPHAAITPTKIENPSRWDQVEIKQLDHPGGGGEVVDPKKFLGPAHHTSLFPTLSERSVANEFHSYSSTAMWTVLARDNIFLLGWHQSELIIGHSHAMVHAASPHAAITPTKIENPSRWDQVEIKQLDHPTHPVCGCVVAWLSWQPRASEWKTERRKVEESVLIGPPEVARHHPTAHLLESHSESSHQKPLPGAAPAPLPECRTSLPNYPRPHPAQTMLLEKLSPRWLQAASPPFSRTRLNM